MTNPVYQRFIHSEEWNLLRSLRKALDNYTCQFCGDRINLEVHHKYNGAPKYQHITDLGNEDPINHLLCLCSRCHSVLTEDVRERRELNKQKLQPIKRKPKK